ncbi:MAG: Lipoprotein signal peptidase [Alphaproteobacteria bacterium MarineAlpha5_Bin8]|nr:MAG: Lipoprotein signal peptidase [Alphaproteobacteria bacterium MarineAlpha5_Bin7]PPR48048.1 MAG: Lipoprotein signal peptidase [Alphaproteobacteria bacterium MarineAlpha5_Bin8]PPR54663.1 MAG: Lipoprotein signal peptidase [Alphaproteobacteria bacterium MarineAlpha5_Bin6]
MKKLFILFLLVSADLLVKSFVYENIQLNSFINILPFLEITHIHNYGISFGLLSGLISKEIIIIISLIITSIIFYLYIKSFDKIEKWGLLIIIAGAISNIVDRALNDYVLDFIHLQYNNYYWPAFNFADIYITIGVLLILYKVVIDLKKNKI